MAPKTAEKSNKKKVVDTDSGSDSDTTSNDSKPSVIKKTKKQQHAEMLSKLTEDKKTLDEKKANLQQEEKEWNKRFAAYCNKVNKTTTPRQLKPVPIPDAIVKFINAAIKGKKLTDKVIEELDIDVKKQFTTDMKMDRQHVLKIMWNYITNNCKKDKNENTNMPIYHPDATIGALIGDKPFDMGSLNKSFATLYPPAEKTVKKTKSKKDDTASDSESDSESESESDSESEEDVKTAAKSKAPVKGKAVTKSKN